MVPGRFRAAVTTILSPTAANRWLHAAAAGRVGMGIHLRIRRISSTRGRQPWMRGGLVLGLTVLAACGADDMGDVERGDQRATHMLSCQHPAAALVRVRVVDQAEAPVTGVVVTLTIDGDRDGAVATTDGRGIASFAAVASCASVGIWVSRGSSDLGFVQVRLRPGHTVDLTVRIRHSTNGSVAPRAR